MLREKRLRRAFSSGFTLIELLIVAAIVALVALVGAPWFARISHRTQLASTAREVQTTLVAARMTAVRKNAPTSVRIIAATPGVDHHTIETWLESGTPRRLAQLHLAPNVRFASLPSGDRVDFTPDGRRAPAGVAHQDIVLEGPTAAAYANQVVVQAWENGRVAFVPPVPWR